MLWKRYFLQVWESCYNGKIYSHVIYSRVNIFKKLVLDKSHGLVFENENTDQVKNETELPIRIRGSPLEIEEEGNIFKIF